MSYDIYLKDPETGATLEADQPHLLVGGTFALGGTAEMWLNITYNYASHFHRVLGPGGVRSLYGMTGEESIPRLQDAISRLGEDVDEDYWNPTEGNARKALCDLLTLAEMRPDGVFDGD